MKGKPNYYSIMPADVRYDETLSASEKLLYSEITALTNKDGTCWASNGYFSKLYGVSTVTVSRWIKKLRNQGYITSEIIYRNGTKEIEKRVMRINKNVGTPINKNVKGGINKNVKGNTTSINTTSSNRASTELTERFEHLWQIYPKKKGKQKAFTSYVKSINEGTADEEIEEGINKYINEIKTTGTKEQYIKYGSTWFGNKGWLDDYESKSRTKGKPSLDHMFKELNKGGSA